MSAHPERPQLTPEQAVYVERARKVLEAAAADRDPANLPDHCGALGWHLGEMLALVADLADVPVEPACMCTDPDCPDPVHQELITSDELTGGES